MAGITLAIAEAKLSQWLAAEDAVSQAQSYEIGGRKLTRVDAGEIEKKINYWNRWCQRLGGGKKGGNRVVRVQPVDI